MEDASQAVGDMDEEAGDAFEGVGDVTEKVGEVRLERPDREQVPSHPNRARWGGGPPARSRSALLSLRDNSGTRLKLETVWPPARWCR